MQTNRQIVLVLNSDPQVLKGLMLLLEDMRFQVLPASQWAELENNASKLSGCPALMLLPFETDTHNSGIDLVRKLRLIFNYRIPAILLCHENGHAPEQYIDEEVMVLSYRNSPQQLRNTIMRMLHNESVV